MADDMHQEPRDGANGRPANSDDEDARATKQAALRRLLLEPPFLTIAADTPVNGSLDADNFNLAPRLGPLYDIIRHGATRMPLAAAVTGPWGSGKTSAMKWLDQQLITWTETVKAGRVKANGETLVPVKTVWFYPWKYSSREDVWRGLIAEVIIACLEEAPDSVADFIREMNEFSGFLGKIVWTVASGLTLSVGNKFTKAQLKPLKGLDNRIQEHFRPETAFLNEFESTLKRWVEKWLTDHARLVVFIDDLDRCLPEVALEVLEALKLYLNMDRIIFVIGVDRGVVNQMIVKHYDGHGVDDIKAREYLGKMFQVEVPVSPTDDQTRTFLNHLLNDNDAWNGIDGDAANNGKAVIQGAIADLAEESPREIKRLVNTCLIFGAGARYGHAGQDDSDPRDLDLAILRGMQFYLIHWILEHKLGGRQGRLSKAPVRQFFEDWSKAVAEHGVHDLRLSPGQARQIRDWKAQDDQRPKSAGAPSEDAWKAVLDDTGPRGRARKEDEDSARFDGLGLHPRLRALLDRHRGNLVLEALCNTVLADLMQIPFSADLAEDLAGTLAPDGNGAKALQDALDAAIEEAPGDTPEEKRGNVKKLDLSETDVTDLAPLSGLQNLQGLYLPNTPVQDLGPLSGLQNLEWLNLQNTPVQDLGPLSGLQNLCGLNLENTPVQDLGPLSSLQNLKWLYLKNTGVQDLGPLSGVQNLDWLDLQNTPVQDLGPLSGLQNLHGLNLEHTPVQDLGPLSSLEQLWHLFLTKDQIVQDQIDALQKALPDLDIECSDAGNGE